LTTPALARWPVMPRRVHTHGDLGALLLSAHPLKLRQQPLLGSYQPAASSENTYHPSHA
jgi:hypothetical protein